MTRADDTPIDDAEFAALMAQTGPFESHPAIAVACSGGPDSMALAALLKDWTVERNGTLTALIVDHGIRQESAREARKVAGWLDAAAITSEILRWAGPRGSGDLQAAARQARYDLLSAWCAARGCLHLAVAHHQEDQAETVLLRLARGSGVDGLSGMTAVSEHRQYRVLRPLLPVPRTRLHATLTARNLPHVMDPSNRSDAFARVRMRKLAPELEAEGMTPGRLAATAAHLGRAREALEGATARLLADTFVLHDAGYGYLDASRLLEAPREIGLRALAGILVCIGGAVYPPRFDRLMRLYAGLDGVAAGGGRTLAGCRIVARRGAVLICREASAIDDTVPARNEVFWDNRFRLRFAARGAGEVGRLGRAGWLEIVAAEPGLKASPIPPIVRPSLPAVRRDGQVVAVPHLGYGAAEKRLPSDAPKKMRFAPLRPLVSPRFTLH